MSTAKLRGFFAFVAILCLGLPSGALAEVRIGMVDQQRGLLSTAAGREAQKSLEALAEVKQKELEPRQKEYQRQQEDLESQRTILTPNVWEERRLDLERQRRELEREVAAVRDELTIQERKMLRPILEKWVQAVREIGQERNFDVILDRSTPGMAFAKDELNITEMVIERVNAME